MPFRRAGAATRAKAALAAISLLSENAGAAARLDALRRRPIDELAAGASPDSAWLAQLVGGTDELLGLEDPPPQPFSDRVVFHRTATVLPGPVDDSVFVARMLLRALFLDATHAPAPLRVVAEATARLALDLSHGICRRAGVEPYLEPSGSGAIVVPEPARLRALADAVCWTDQDVRRSGPGASAAATRLAATRFRPLERVPEGWVVSAPGLLLAALADALVTAARELELGDDLQRRYEAALRLSVDESLASFGFYGFEALPGTARLARRASAPSGETVVVVQPTSRMEHSFAREPGTWPHVDTAEASTGIPCDPDGLVLVTAQPFADPYFDGAAREDGPWTLGLSAADLEVLSAGAEGDAAALARFARSAQRLRTRHDVVRFSTLDEYAVYRDHGGTYDLGPTVDEPAVLSLRPGAAAGMRLSWARDRDVMGLPWPGHAGLVEAVRRYPGHDVPIYEPPPWSPAVARAVPGTPVLWVLADPPPGIAGATAREWAQDALGLVDAAAFWLWQLRPRLAPVLARLARGGPLAVRVDPSGLWAGPGDAVPGPPTIRVARTGDREVLLAPASPLQGPEDSNAGDRALAAALVRAVALLAGRPVGAASAEALAAEVAPPGPRRMVVALDLVYNAEIDRDDTPRPRRLDAGELDWARARTGQALLRSGWRAGAYVGAADQTGVLNEGVAVLFSELQDRVRELDVEDLVMALLWQVEASIRESAVARLQVPLILATLGPGPSAERAVKAALGLEQPLVATRFLVELAAAGGRRGPGRAGGAEVDELLARAALLVEMGSASDASRHGMTRGEVRLRASGRIAYDPAFGLAMAELGSGLGRSGLAAAVRDIADHWEAPGGPGPGESGLDAAYAAEFGFSATDHARFVNAAALLADEVGRTAVVVPRRRLVEEVELRTGWPSGRAEAILDALSLRPRGSYQEPPPGAAPHDLYPWRFSRRHSLVRRPFVVVPSGSGERVAYGTRHLFVSALHLTDLVGTGRLEAASPEMQALQGQLSATASRALVAEVAGRCRELGFAVSTNVRKLGSLRMVDRGADLGDLDVVAVSPAGTVWLLECKSLNAARTPWELRSALDRLLGPRGFAAKHARRAAWVSAHASDLASAGIPARADVRGAIVTSLPLPPSLLAAAPIPIVDVRGLGELVGAVGEPGPSGD